VCRNSSNDTVKSLYANWQKDKFVPNGLVYSEGNAAHIRCKEICKIGGHVMRLYGLKTCDTCRRAVKSLKAAGRDVTLIDVRAEPLDAAELGRFFAQFGDALINTRSTTWRGLSEDERAEAPVALLQAHPALMKRPVIEADGQLYLGWDSSVQEALA
jgi:Spx/MgsR family transcriptional regulator